MLAPVPGVTLTGQGLQAKFTCLDSSQVLFDFSSSGYLFLTPSQPSLPSLLTFSSKFLFPSSSFIFKFSRAATIEEVFVFKVKLSTSEWSPDVVEFQWSKGYLTDWTV